MAHHGWRHLAASWRDRAERAADALRRVGLTRAGEAVGGLAPALALTEPRRVLDAWADVHVRLLVTAEQL